MSDSVRPHKWQPTSLPCPWDSPGKNTGVGCHFLLQCMKVKSEGDVAQSCPTFRMDCSLPGSSVHGIFQARVLEWGAIAFLNSNLCISQVKIGLTSQLHVHFHFHALEKEMATHSSILACRIPGTEKPGGLPFMGSHRVGHD